MEDYLNQVWRIVDNVESFQIDHILRECNKEADKVANEAIDKHMSRK
jgi:ribonuclease HI